MKKKFLIIILLMFATTLLSVSSFENKACREFVPNYKYGYKKAYFINDFNISFTNPKKNYYPQNSCGRPRLPWCISYPWKCSSRHLPNFQWILSVQMCFSWTESPPLQYRYEPRYLPPVPIFLLIFCLRHGYGTLYTPVLEESP